MDLIIESETVTSLFQCKIALSTSCYSIYTSLCLSSIINPLAVDILSNVCGHQATFCSFLQSPDEGTRQTLRSLFPGSGSSRQSLTFRAQPDIPEPPPKKKKLSLERRKRVTVCLLPPSVSTVPRGSTRSWLCGEGRVKDILFLRSWTEMRVRQTIAEAFLRALDPEDPEGDILFMSSNAGAGISDAPDPSTFQGLSSEVGWTGNKLLALAGRGNLYVRSKKEVQQVNLESLLKQNMRLIKVAALFALP